MIPVAEAKEPKAFDADVRQPGLLALAEMAGKTPAARRKAGKPFAKIADGESDIPSSKFPSYWTKALGDLLTAYNEVCAYACFRIHAVTGARSADHFAPKSRNWKSAYEWSNYRLCCSRMNARKNDFDGVLDPFKIQPSWFQLELLGFQVIPNPTLTEAKRKAIQRTIDRLGLNEFRNERCKDADRYWSSDVSLKVLKQESPFVAEELKRQGRLNPGDVW